MCKKNEQIKTDRDFINAMRTMVKRVRDGSPALPENPTHQDLEILTECINQGYLLSRYEKNGQKVLRTMDGVPHPSNIEGVVPLKGFIFIAFKIDWKFIIPTAISLAALAVSIVALFKS